MFHGGFQLAELAQAYIHLKPYSVRQKKVRSLGLYAEKVAKHAAIEIYGGGVVVEVELEEGSLITRVTVIGSLLLAASGHVADYKGFKESVVEMCDDAREFAIDVCAPFTKKAGVSKEDVYRFERRLKTPGKLFSLSRRLEKLERSTGNLSPRDVQKELSNLRSDLEGIAIDLSQQELDVVTGSLQTKHLPAPNKWPQNDGPPKDSVRRARQLNIDFDDEPEDESRQERRIVFRSTVELPGTLRIRKRKPVSAGAYLPELET